MREPPPGFSPETRIRRDARGRWYDDDVPIEHEGIERAFDRWLERDPETRRYRLNNELSWGWVTIEGPPIFVRAARLDAAAAVLILSDARVEPLDPTTLRQDADGALYCDVRGATMTARFDTAAAVALSDALVETPEGVAFAHAGARHPIPVVTDPVR